MCECDEMWICIRDMESTVCVIAFVMDHVKRLSCQEIGSYITLLQPTLTRRGEVGVDASAWLRVVRESMSLVGETWVILRALRDHITPLDGSIYTPIMARS